jgi:hypothetical protein
MGMSKTELERIFDPATFTPLVLTTKDGFALSVASAHDVLIGLRMVVIKLSGKLYQIPFHAIAHISEPGKTL